VHNVTIKYSMHCIAFL